MAQKKSKNHSGQNAADRSLTVARPPRNIAIKIPQPFTVRQESTTEADERYTEESDGRRAQLRTATHLNWITIGGGVIALFSLIAVYIGIYQNKLTFERGQRAWMGLDLDPKAKVIILGDSGLPDRFSISFKNFGQSPAFNLRMYAELDASNKFPDWPIVEQKIDKIALPIGLNSISVFNGQPVPYVGSGPVDTDEFRTQIRTANAAPSLILIGKAIYEDEFRRSHETTFCIRFAPISMETGLFHEGWQTCPIGNQAT